jgi:hypothetical protein
MGDVFGCFLFFLTIFGGLMMRMEKSCWHLRLAAVLLPWGRSLPLLKVLHFRAWATCREGIFTCAKIGSFFDREEKNAVSFIHRSQT